MEVKSPEAGNRVDRGDFDRLVVVEIREDAGQPLGEERLADSWWADHRHVMTARSSDAERELRMRMSPNVAEIGLLELGFRDSDRPGGTKIGTAQDREYLGEADGTRHNDPRQPRDLSGAVRRHDDPRETTVSGRQRSGKCSASSPQSAIKAEFPDERRSGKINATQLIAGCQHADRNRQIHAGSVLGDLCRGEADGHPPVGPSGSGALDSRSSPPP